MKRIFRIVGILIFYSSGVVMFFCWLGAMSEWLGCIGSFLAFVFCPGLVIFPIIYWIVEGVFPVTYFVAWGIGILGGIIWALTGDILKDDSLYF